VAQLTAEHAAMNSLRKGKWEKARGQLAKAIKKDSLNPSAHFSLSIYFFTPANPDFQIDSAYRYTLQAFSNYQFTTAKQRDRLKRIPLDSIILTTHRERIDSAAFDRAKSKNTEIGYVDFLERFPLASQRMRAVELRDEVAYLDALKENTYAAFLKYLEKYPESDRAYEARVRYEKLLFESKTKDRKLSSYESFLLDHPATPYRKEVEKQIFEIVTASGEAVEFENFLKKYPKSSNAAMARNVLYHLLKEEERLISSTILNDSIRKIQLLQKHYLVPFLKNNSFGFMNERGEEIITPVADQIPDDYLCGNITDELLIIENKIVARNGAVIYHGEIKEVEHLGYGFMKVIAPTCIKVIHYSGFNVSGECIQSVKLLQKNYLALQKENRWSVWTLTGRMLMDYQWDDIQQIENVLVFLKSRKYKLSRLRDIAQVANQLPNTFTQLYDEVKSWPNGMIWVKTGNEQGVLNQNLNDWVKPVRQEITPTFFGAVSQTNTGYRLHDRTSVSSQNFSRVIINQPWVAVLHEGAWRLINPVSKQYQSPAFDTITFSGPFSIGQKKDSLRIYLTKNSFVESLQTSNVRFLPGKDSLFFLLIEESDKKTLYDINGEILFTFNFDRLEYNNEGFFTVVKKDKRGLISLNGKLILQPEYDAIGTISQGLVQVLKDKKFGLVDITHRKAIKTGYDKNVAQYNTTKLIAFKNGLYGLIGWDNKSITSFEYEEVGYWNDSSALVKKNFNWFIYNFIDKKVVMDKIKTFTWVLNTAQEKIMIVQQENNYGVISNRKGTIIPATFTDIVNLGPASVPLYFTEKHVEEASIFVVIYYDKNGVQLRKQVYETDDYEKIYCSGN